MVNELERLLSFGPEGSSILFQIGILARNSLDSGGCWDTEMLKMY